MQRLFSTFADGWPGVGLLIQRILTAILLIRVGFIDLSGRPFSPSIIPQIIASFGGVLLLAGMWTPITGAIIACLELWIAFTNTSDPWLPITLAVFGSTIAMIGPGAWSIDARLFGRKHITS